MLYMTDAEREVIARNPFTLPGMATHIEEYVGEVMLNFENKRGHKPKMPLSSKVVFGISENDPTYRIQKAEALAKFLEGKPPMGRVELGAALGCTKETIGRYAIYAINMGLLRKISTNKIAKGKPSITYVVKKLTTKSEVSGEV